MTHPIRKTWISGLGYQRETVASICGRGIRTRGQREVRRACTCGKRGYYGPGSLKPPLTLIYKLDEIAEEGRNEVSGVNTRNL